MKNFKLLNAEVLLENLKVFEHKKICAMVKANAYGHGLKEIVPIVEEQVDYFGVVSVDEAVAVRKLTEKPILVCSEVFDLKTCRNKDIEIMVDNEKNLLDAIKNKNKIHLKINSGMNRFGVKSTLELKQIDNILQDKNVELKSIYTHFSQTESKTKTKKQYEKFLRMKEQISQKAPICFGGSGIIDYPFGFDMVRVGIGMYGYAKNTRPVEEIHSFVSKVFYAKQGEFIGYGSAYKVNIAGFFAVVPVGYGDGLRRNLSGKFYVDICGKKFKAVGNICMDAFFVRVDESIKVGAEVVVMKDANDLKGDSIVYEVLSGFSNFRGKTLIKH